MTGGRGRAYRTGVTADSARPQLRRELAVALLAALVQVGGTTLAAVHQHPARPLDLAGYLLLALGPALLPWRLRYPVGVLLAEFGLTLTYLLAGYPLGPIYAALVVAFLTCALERSRLIAYTVLGVGYVTVQFGVPWVRGQPWPSLAAASAIAVWMLLLLAAAEGLIARRAAARAAAARRREEERRRAEAERRRASDERLQIARELHDVLAHSLSVINVQSGVALELVDQRPEQARQALTAIKATSREALAEVQGILDALRRPQEQVPLTPAPSLADLASLARKAQDAGLTVVTRVDGAPVPLPARVDLAGARLVQEALTNVLRHSASRRVELEVRYQPGEVRVRVTDDGPPRTPAAAGQAADAVEDLGGNGIPGMRERALALGGTLEAAPHGDGFRVTGTFPLAASAAVVPAEAEVPG
jgi:signal transduction histidine kinase